MILPRCAKSNIKQYSLNNLKTYQNIHTKEKHYACDAFDEVFTQKGHLKTHQLIHTGDTFMYVILVIKTLHRKTYSHWR